MKRLSILVLVLLSICISVNASRAQDWARTYGGSHYDEAYSIHQTSDGGYIIVGYSVSIVDPSETDIYLIKTDSQGDSVWTKKFGEGGADWGFCVQQTTDGGYIITGGKSSTLGNFIPDYVWLIKTDNQGDTLWTKTIGGSSGDRGYYVQQTNDGGYIIAGVSAVPNTSFMLYNDVSLIKTDSVGNTLWTKIFGGNDVDDACSVQQTTDGGYIVIGWTNSFGNGNDVYLIKTNSQGDSLWTRTFGGINNDRGRSVQQTNDGGYIITGQTEKLNGDHDVWLLKTDSQGDTLWTKTFGGSGSENSFSIQQTTDGGYIITGASTPSILNGKADIYLIKTDSQGEILWNNENLLSSHIKLYPNPTNDLVNLEIEGYNCPFEVEIYDLQGRLLETTKSRTISLKKHSKGIYIFKLSYGLKTEEFRVIRD